jgi:hypothetical protein
VAASINRFVTKAKAQQQQQQQSPAPQIIAVPMATSHFKASVAI